MLPILKVLGVFYAYFCFGCMYACMYVFIYAYMNVHADVCISIEKQRDDKTIPNLPQTILRLLHIHIMLERQPYYAAKFVDNPFLCHNVRQGSQCCSLRPLGMLPAQHISPCMYGEGYRREIPSDYGRD